MLNKFIQHGNRLLALPGLRNLFFTGFVCSLPLAGQVKATPQARGQQVQAELITISLHGVTPSQITRKAGKFVLEINNKTVDPRSALVVELCDGTGNLVKKGVDSASLKRSRHSSTMVDLQPGDYQLRAAQSGRVLCEIHIQ